jgi:protein TonB
MDRRRALKYAPFAVGGLVLVLILVGVVLFIRAMLSGKEQKTQRVVQTITVIRPPPPPPDQPPPPPPDKVEEQIPQNEPDPTPDNTPAPQQQLGIDAEGGAGGDAFGLAARKGGSDLVGTGGAVFAWYQKKIQTAISDRLSQDNCLHAKRFTLELRIQIQADGALRIEQVLQGTGDRQLDGCIAADLSGASVRVDEAPPIEFPRLASVKIVQRS